MAARRRQARSDALESVLSLWGAIFGQGAGFLAAQSAIRPRSGSRKLLHNRGAFFPYPVHAGAAAAWCLDRSREGKEVYFCAHLLTDRRRIKENAAPVLSLWAEHDGSEDPGRTQEVLADLPPTAVVETSPGRSHLYWRLRAPVEPARAELLNRRLALALGADPAGWDLSQLLRPPSTRNRKYEQAPAVRLLSVDEGETYHPRELEIALPPDDREGAANVRASGQEAYPLRVARPTTGAPVAIGDLSRLSSRARDLIVRGNSGAGSPYPSRSEADFAACLAMFSAGYDEAEVWAVMTDPSNGISEKYLEKGRHGDRYLALTIRNARSNARGKVPRSVRGNARRARNAAA